MRSPEQDTVLFGVEITAREMDMIREYTRLREITPRRLMRDVVDSVADELRKLKAAPKTHLRLVAGRK